MVATGWRLSIAFFAVCRNYRSKRQFLYFAGQLEYQPMVHNRRSCAERIVVHLNRQGSAGKQRPVDDLPVQL